MNQSYFVSQNYGSSHSTFPTVALTTENQNFTMEHQIWKTNKQHWTIKNQQWTMGNPCWTMKNGHCIIENQHWTMENHHWTLDKGKQIGQWKTAIGQGETRPFHYIFFGEKHRRQIEKLKRSAPAEVVQPSPNIPAPAEVCPAPISPAEFCSSWPQKTSRRRNFYTANVPKFT